MKNKKSRSSNKNNNFLGISDKVLNSKPLKWLFKLRTKLIVPYVSLTLIVAMVGIFIVTQLVSSSVQDRFSNLLIDSSGAAADLVVRQERVHLESLRLMAFTEGVVDAISLKDSDRLEELLYPLVLNEGIQSLSVMDSTGVEIVSFIQDPETKQYNIFLGSDLSGIESVNLVINGMVDQFGDKFSNLETTIFGSYLFTSAPIVEEDSNRIIGALLIGTHLKTLLTEIKIEALADMMILNSEGRVLEWTFPLVEGNIEDLEIGDDGISSIADPPGHAYLKLFDINEDEYQAYYSPLVLRQRDIGILGVALQTEFVVNTTSRSQSSLILIFTIITTTMVITGYLLSIMISRPILKLRDISNKVAAGDLQQQSGLKRRDEIGDLAESFDKMVYDLRDHTAALIQSEKLSAVGELSAGIAHDVKNPLAVIKGMAEEIQDDIDDQETIDMLEIIRENATRASTIITDLMKFTRQSNFELKTQNICNTVDSSIRLTDFLARKGKVNIETNFKTNPINVSYDSQQLEQVIVNLIQNAIQAMPDGGNIQINAYESGKNITLKVKDTGQGIAKKNLDKIFDPFFTTKPEGEGTGLGLSVSFGIIRDHGGSITAESKIGAGTTFTIILPRAA